MKADTPTQNMMITAFGLCTGVLILVVGLCTVPDESKSTIPAAVAATGAPIPDIDETLLLCDVLSIHDGDTMRVRVHFPWGISLEENVRCLGYNAWEVTKGRRTVKVTDDEVKKGKFALQQVQSLIQGNRVFISPESEAGTRDPYGRLLAFVRVESGGQLIRLEQWMFDKGHCRE